MNRNFLISVLCIIAVIAAFGLIGIGCYMAVKSISDWGWLLFVGVIIVLQTISYVTNDYDKEDMQKAWQQGRDNKPFNVDELDSESEED